MQYDLQWISRHAAQSYPLTDQAYAQSVYGKQLPMSFLLDVQIKVPKAYSSTLVNSFYIKSVVDSLDTYTVIIGTHISDGIDFTCLKAYGINKGIDMSTPMQQRYYILVADLQTVPQQYKDMIRRLTGTVYIGVTKNQNIPSIQLEYKQGQLSPICVQTIAGLQALLLGDRVIQGIVRLRAGSGILINTTQQQDQTIIDISVDPDTVYTGAQSVQQAIEEIKAALGQPILAINGVAPDSKGKINIAGLDCVRFDSSKNTANVITVSNTCSKPCCGTVYQDAIKNQIQLIKQQQDILRDYFVQQSNNINYIQASLATVIGSK